MGTTTERCHGNWQSKFCCKTLFFNIVTTLTNAFLTMMNKSLHAMLLKICTSGGDPLSPLLKHTTTTSHPLTGSSQTFSKCWWTSVSAVFPHERIQWHTCASYTLPCQTPFCQSAPPLQFLTQQQNSTEYWPEGSASTAIPTYISWHDRPTE